MPDTAKIMKLEAQVSKLLALLDEYHEVSVDMQRILNRTANALSGDPPANTMWGWANLPELAIDAVRARDAALSELSGRIAGDAMAKASEASKP